MTGLEAEIQAERKAQRDLKLVLAAAEQQAQRNSIERGEIAVRYWTSSLFLQVVLAGWWPFWQCGRLRVRRKVVLAASPYTSDCLMDV